MMRAVGDEYLNRGDFIVMDNATIHSGGDCEDLEELLWDFPGADGLPMEISVIFLPTRSPELNPIELIWNTLVQRLKLVDLQGPRPQNHAVAHFAAQILCRMNHHLATKTAVHCGYRFYY